MFGPRVGPQLTFDVKRHHVPLDIRPDSETPRGDARLKYLDGLNQFFLHAIEVRRCDSAKITDPKVDNGPVGMREIFEIKRLHSLQTDVGGSIKKPFKIAQNAAAILLVGHNALQAALLLYRRIVVAQAIQQARL